MPAHVLFIRVSAGSQVPACGPHFNTLSCLIPFAGSSATYNFPKTESLPKKQMFSLNIYIYQFNPLENFELILNGSSMAQGSLLHWRLRCCHSLKQLPHGCVIPIGIAICNICTESENEIT